STHRIFANNVCGCAVRNALRDFLPGFAEVARSVNVRAKIVKPKAVDRSIRSPSLEMRGFDNGDLAPRLELRRRNILPGLAAVPGDVDQSIVRSSPDRIRFFERWRDRVDDAAMFALLRIGIRKRTEIGGNFVRCSRQVGTHNFPTIPG